MGCSVMRLTLNHLPAVTAVLKHPEIYRWIADDQTGPVEHYSAEPLLANEAVYFLMPRPGCLAIYSPLVSGIMYQVHMAIVPSMRGSIGYAAGQETVRWMFENTPARKLVGFTPSNNRVAILFALKQGFRKTGKITGGRQQHGKILDLVITELDK